jgi:glycosyltransferase involved in cell wall biosynthesis
MGRPTVSNPYGDIKNLFDNYRIGLLADFDPQDFAQKIIHLLGNPNLATKIGKNARQVAETQLNWKVIIKKLEDFYFQILDHRDPSKSYL